MRPPQLACQLLLILRRIKKAHSWPIEYVGASIGRPPTWRSNAFSGYVFFHRQTGTGEQCSPLQEFFDSRHTQGRYKAIPHNSKCRYGERGAAAAKPNAQIILDAAKVSAASGGYSEPKQGQRSQSARGFCPEARCGYRNPTLSSILATQRPCRTPSRSEALRSATDALRRLLARRSAEAVLKP